MKYLLASLFIHVLLVGLLSFETWNSSPPIRVVVELHVLPQPGEASNSKVENANTLRDEPRFEQKDASLETESQSLLESDKRRYQITAQAPSESRDLQPELTEEYLRSQEGQQMMASYAEQLKLYLEQNKVYPRTALRLKQSGVVTIKLQIRNDGQFGEIQIASPSPFSTLNQAAVDLLRKLGHFKPLPPKFGTEEEFLIPIAYRLERGTF